jgi:hypothetical protein
MRSTSTRRSRLARLAAVGLALLLVAFAGGDAAAKKKPKHKYHFTLAGVKAAEGVEGKLAADALRLLEAELKKQFASHPQMVPDLSAGPDPQANPKKFAAWLKKKKIKGAYQVNVDLTLYIEETEAAPSGKEGDLRFVIRVELHMFGETIPERKMAFEGEGSATVKQDVGKKVRDRDREFTIQSAIELAVVDAMAESFRKLSAPPPKKKKK